MRGSGRRKSFLARFAVRACFPLVLLVLSFIATRYVYGTGGTFFQTEHGGTDATYPDRAYYPATDGVTGVNRGRIIPPFGGFYDDTEPEAGKYKAGECSHCHEPHASFGGSEPVPNWFSHGANGEGPDKYLLLSNYDTQDTRAELCGNCHQETDPDANGVQFDTPSDFSFQGVTKFKDTAHFLPPGGRTAARWPGGQYGSTYPQKSISEAGTCVNCHTPHGYPYSSSDGGVGVVPEGTPYPKQLVELTDINNQNPSTSPITGWPNVAGRDPDDAEDLCYTCHDGNPVVNNDLATYNAYGSGYMGSLSIKDAFAQSTHHPVKDSEQSAKTSYYHGTGAQNMSIHNRVECTTCHNPHLASGRWDDATSAWPSPTPVVLPGVTHDAYGKGFGTYDWPPPSWGLSYQPGDLWGDGPDEKIDALMQRFPNSGTGGWQFNINRGYAYGSSPPFDQPPVYQPPIGGTGSGQYSPDGDALPDYITFCLDCHQHKVGNRMPIYWGAGFPPGVVNPPTANCPWDNCVTSTGNEPHGFDAANNSPFGCCSGYTCDNPTNDTSSPFYGEPRGRGSAVFTRAPYEMADRKAGINYVLACTDCHEPHGSPVGGLLRAKINGNDGSTTHNTLCNACHYYYAGDMTYDSCGGGGLKGCAGASCHETNVLHRIKKNNSGGGAVLYTPTWACTSGMTMPVVFDFNEAPGSATASDNSGSITGTVYNAAAAFPNPSNGSFNGSGTNDQATEDTAGTLSTHIDFLNNDSCLKATTRMTVETLIRPLGIPDDTTTSYLRKVIGRQAVPGNYAAGVARLGSAGSPDFHRGGTLPGGIASAFFDANLTGGNGWARIYSDWAAPGCSITNDRWYRIKYVWDSNKSSGIPLDIYIADMGTGASEPTGAPSYINCTNTTQDLVPSNQRLQTGDTMLAVDGDWAIGANSRYYPKHSWNVFNGKIGWIKWWNTVQ